jgi:hypothetical protein
LTNDHLSSFPERSLKRRYGRKIRKESINSSEEEVPFLRPKKAI